MPITYTIDRERGYAHVVWKGDVVISEFEDHLRHLLVDPEAIPFARSFGDLRQATPRFTGAEIRAAIQLVALPALAGRKWKVAALVEHPFQHGMARQFQVLANDVGETQVFHDESAALTWLLATP